MPDKKKSSSTGNKNPVPKTSGQRAFERTADDYRAAVRAAQIIEGRSPKRKKK